ncbi:MAG TPA: beta-ketoacyl synthase chain length factor [Bacteroidales bacterium]|nr:beta-ketoacyl synthase chain length factor [Bacteroidales bacterium]
MKTYINAAAAMCPLPISEKPFDLAKPEKYPSDYLKCIEPDYKEYINPALIRRMGRVVKMGVATAVQCLREAGLEKPDAVITGTGLGCIEDTESFLNEIIRNKEQFLPPTSFIQSTHNTIAGQIALLLKCNSYNHAYVHRCFSFENALLDAMMMIHEQQDSKILLGGVDEITPVSYSILKRLGIYKSVLGYDTAIFDNPTDGSIAGEGASFFVLSGDVTNSIAAVNAVKTFYKPADSAQTRQNIEEFIQNQGFSIRDMDAVLMGYSSDQNSDALYNDLSKGIFAENNILYYKHICGEYFTSSSFAVWTAAQILKHNHCPDALKLRFDKVDQFKHILIYNHFKNSEHVLILLSSC